MPDSYKYRITGTDDYNKVFFDKVAKTLGEALAIAIEDAYVGDNDFPQESPVRDYEISMLKSKRGMIYIGKEKNSSGEIVLSVDANEMY